MSEKLYHRVLDNKEELLSNRKGVFQKGRKTGFRCLDEIASFVTGYTTVVYSPPHVGKSVITLDLLMAQAEMGANIFIYSPEFRKKEELQHSLIQTRISKCFFGKKSDTITDQEFLQAMDFVDKHFVVLTKAKRKKDNSQVKMSIETIFSEARKAEIEYNMKFDFIFIDPFNFLDRSESTKYLDMQEYVFTSNDMLAEFSEALGVHTIISAHTRDVELVTDKDTGKRYYDVGHFSEIMGGQSWGRASYQILHYWRAPEGVVNKDTGVPYPPDYNIIHTQKAKPFGSGKISNTAIAIPGVEGLFFDKDTFTMYEKINGKKYYRNEWYNEQQGTSPQAALKPSTAFDDSDDDDIF